MNAFIHIRLPDPTICNFSKTISWGRLLIYNRKRTFKPRLPVYNYFQKLSKILTLLLWNCKNYKKFHALKKLCSTFLNFHQRMFFPKTCLQSVAYRLADNASKNYDFSHLFCLYRNNRNENIF